MNLSSFRFPQSELTLKPGSVKGDRALCLVYADSRAYQDALDAADVTWATNIVAVNDKTVIVALTINGCTRSASGEDTDFMSAEARAFKRACSAFGLGRYLYSIDLGWQPYDGKHFGQAAYNALQKALAASSAQSATVEEWQSWSGPEDAYQWAVDAGVVKATAHARNALQKLVNEKFGGKMTMTNWPEVAHAYYQNRLQRQEEKEAA